MFEYALKSLRANLTRFISTSLAIILGIGFLASGLMLTDAIKAGLTGDVDIRYRNVDLAVVGNSVAQELAMEEGVPSKYLDEIRALDGVAAAEAEMQANVRVERSDGGSIDLRTMGRVWPADDKLNPLSLDSGRAPRSADEIVISRDLAQRGHIKVGQDVELSTPLGAKTAKVVGVSVFEASDAVDDGGTVSFTESTALSILSAGSDAVSDIIIRTHGDPTMVQRQLEQLLPPSLSVRTHDEFIEDATRMTVSFVNVLRPVLQGFAYLAMFVSGFVIFNTFSVIVTQRYKELALIRAIGGSPKQVRRSLLAEGLVIGAGASVIGIVFGMILAKALQLVLKRFDLSVPGTGVRITLGTVILCMIVGTLVTVVSIIIPAFRAGRTKPVEAMRDASVDTSGTSPVRAAIGGTFLGIGLLLLAVNQLTQAKWYYIAPGGFLLFVGLFIGGPLLARLFAALIRPAMKAFGLTGDLAADNVVRNPKRTATTANALVIGLFLVTLVTVSGEAMKVSVVQELNKLAASDFFIASENAISLTLVDKVDQTQGVSSSAAIRSSIIADQNDRIFSLAGTDVTKLVETTGVKVIAGSLDDVIHGNGIASVDTTSLGVQEGGGGTSIASPRIGEKRIFTAADGSEVKLTVAALIEAKLDSLLLGDLVSNETFARVIGEKPITTVLVRAESGQANAVGTRLEKAVRGYTGIEIFPGNFIGQTVAQVFDFLMAAVNALLAMSVVVALVGIVNTMTLAIFERRHELGVVRALGMTRRQVGAMVRMEAIIMGVIGTAIGMSAGVFLSWILISSIPDADLQLSLNWARVGAILAVGLSVGLIASIVPAARATRLDMLDAIRSE